MLESVDRLQARWGRKLGALEVDVALDPDEGSLARAAARADTPPLGSALSGTRQRVARLILFRRPIETLAGSPEALPWLVHDVVVELAAELLGLPPEDVDPGYRGAGPDPEQ